MNRKFNKCFITGITGSAGSFLADYILNKDKNIKIIGTFRNKNKLRNIKKSNSKRVILENLDLLNFTKVKNFLKNNKPDLIYHFASNADVRKSFDVPKEIILNNNNITLNLLEAIRELNLKTLIIICSTPEVYGNVENKNKPISEKEIMKPQSPYAVSKCFQDLLAQAYAKSFNLKIIITRMFSYTNSRRFTLFQSSFAKQIVEIEQNKRKYLEHGNLKSIRTFIDINDALEAYWLTAKKGKIGEIYNIGGKNTDSVENVLKKLISFSKVKIKSKINKKLLRPTDVTKQIPDCKKFKKHTKWSPRINLEESLLKLLKDIRFEFKK
tara:strand:- start:3135 stop:4109 length:975 start_codon:yes stop_codon:yes gene_type:complete